MPLFLLLLLFYSNSRVSSMKTLYTAAILALINLLVPTGASAEAPYQVEWTRQIGTASYDGGDSVAVDSSGNVYITGYTQGSLEGASAGGPDAFLMKFDSSGTELWRQQIGSAAHDYSNSVALDGSDNVYISGYTSGSLEGTSAGDNDAFLIKFDSSGSELWTKQLGTVESDLSRSLAVDSSGNAYISGHTTGSLEGTNAGDSDAFLTKFDSSGTELWRQQIGTASVDISLSVAIDSLGNAYISGGTLGDLGGAHAGGLWDAFLTKFDSNGTELWIKQIGTVENDLSRSVAVDGSGNVYISGNTNGSLEGTNAGVRDAFLMKLDSNGSELWAQQIGTTGHDASDSVAIDNLGNAYISGNTNGSLEGTNAGSYDVFLTKFDSSGNELWRQQIGTAGFDESSFVAVDGSGNAYISGSTGGSLEGTSAGGNDAFLVKFSAPVPEPSSLLLGGLAVMGFLLRRRPLG